MPTYEFRCPEGHEFERFYKTISAAASELPCPQCGATSGRKLSGGAGLLFKGSGFYLTDYGKNAHRKPDSKPAGEGKGESKKADGGGSDAPAKTESKPAASGDSAKPKADSKSSTKPKAK